MAVQALGIAALSLTGSQSGIITENAHQGARILRIRPGRIEAALATGHVVIVAGYQGVSAQGEVTTLGRGGSDTTAVALGAALGASQVEIYSDVDGVYTADPRLCPQARHLGEVGYEAMEEMSHFGARVLHAQAVQFARAAGIELIAASTVATGKQTRIGPQVTMPKLPCAVAHGRRGTWLCADSAEAMLPMLARCGASSLWPITAHSTGALFAQAPADVAQSVGRDSAVSEAAWVTLVAQGMGPRYVGPSATALASVAVHPWAWFVHPHSVTVVVAPERFDAALGALHALVPADAELGLGR